MLVYFDLDQGRTLNLFWISTGLFSIDVASALVHKAIDVALGPGTNFNTKLCFVDIFD